MDQNDKGLGNSTNILKLIVNELTISDIKDSMQWNFSKGPLKSREVYQLVEGFDDSNKGKWMKIWRMKTPPKV